MNALAIEQLLLGILNAAPALLELYKKVTSGGTATDADVAAIFSKYGIDRAVFVAAIAASEAKGPQV